MAMTRWWFRFRAPVIMVSLFGMLAGPVNANGTAAANRLLVEAVQAWNTAVELTGDDIKVIDRRFALIERVADNLRRIVDEHSDAELAVRLVIGEQIGPISLAIVDAALIEAAAERTMVTCLVAPTRDCVFFMALSSAKEIEDAKIRARALDGIASAQADVGLFAKPTFPKWRAD